MFRPARMVEGYVLFHREHLPRVLDALQDLGRVEFFDIKDAFPGLLPLESKRSAIQAELERVNRLLDETYKGAPEGFWDRLLGPSTIPVVLKRRTEEPLEAIREELRQLEERWGPIRESLEEAEREHRELEKKLKEEEERLLGRGLEEDEASERLQRFGALVAREEEVLARIAELERARRHYSRYARPVLLGLREWIDNLMERDRILGLLGSTPNAVVMGFWVPEKEVARVRRFLDGATGGEFIMETWKPTSGDEPPVLLENPWFIRPYEVLTTNYGYPRYNDLDPTPILAITFTMLFGLMFADVGYGLTLLFLSTAIYLKTNRAERLVRDLNQVLIFAGTASVFFGFLFGEFFGGLVELEPMWRSPLENILILIYLSIFLGAVHITVSLISRAYGELAYGNPPLYPISLLIIMWSLVWFVIIGGTLVPLLSASLAYGLLCLVKTKRGQTPHELLALVGNVISYARVGVLFILHVTVARLMASLLLSLSFSPIGLVVGVLIFVAGTSLILISSAVFVFIHSLRLHWIEFFRRFYSGLGRAFVPFRLEKRYTVTAR